MQAIVKKCPCCGEEHLIMNSSEMDEKIDFLCYNTKEWAQVENKEIIWRHTAIERMFDALSIITFHNSFLNDEIIYNNEAALQLVKSISLILGYKE